MTRLSRNDWLATGFDVLAKEGSQGLTIENLTSKLNITRGSFYYHFHSMEDYKNFLLTFWAEQYSTRVVQLTVSSNEPGNVFLRFLDILAAEDPSIEIILRSWAARDEHVHAYMQHIDEERLIQAQRWFEQSGQTQNTRDLARMFYTLLIGCYSVFPPIKGETLKSFIKQFLIMTGTLKGST